VENYKIVITDTSCFVLLSKIDAFDLLQKLFGTVFTTPEIMAEYGEQLPDWVIVQTVQNHDLLQNYQTKVDPGEASALALAQEIHADLVILDDLDARKFAVKLGISIKGTLGLLAMAKQKGVIASVRPFLEKVSQTNFRVAAYLIEQTLRDAGE
jgi:predicted nucleic acid-binding protein